MKTPNELRTVNVMRYILPLREGGSLPALAEADDGFNYVLKFRGAGQREKALIAELLGGEIARLLGFKVPELVFAELDVAFGRSEGDEEIQDLLKGSQGLNLALHFLSHAINYDPLAMPVDPLLASKIVWLDMLITNVDRTFRNTNMLMWNRELWLIDHGASFLFHHSWHHWERNAKGNFPIIQNHVLLPQASMLDEANEALKPLLTPEIFKQIVSLVPKNWLLAGGESEDPSELAGVYEGFLSLRHAHADQFTKEANHARKTLI
ncbi:aminotransferase class I and II [Echinicola soli]|uniref:Aminotransferase class I and II n=1 Tax=Echinicola soli TaxID=2591634 RepID=A0A514CDM7_9BACT|nr:HipA family kinase [Echinicola soli]QDH77929.1 aminotransferase class I and II [Echinicola soli]